MKELIADILLGISLGGFLYLVSLALGYIGILLLSLYLRIEGKTKITLRKNPFLAWNCPRNSDLTFGQVVAHVRTKVIVVYVTTLLASSIVLNVTTHGAPIFALSRVSQHLVGKPLLAIGVSLGFGVAVGLLLHVFNRFILRIRVVD